MPGDATPALVPLGRPTSGREPSGNRWPRYRLHLANWAELYFARPTTLTRPECAVRTTNSVGILYSLAIAIPQTSS